MAELSRAGDQQPDVAISHERHRPESNALAESTVPRIDELPSRELKSERGAAELVQKAPLTNPDVVQEHELLPEPPPSEAESAPPSIPSAASILAGDTGRHS